MRVFFSIAFSLYSILITNLAYAQDIIVVDANGLIRLHLSHKDTISIEIKVECNPLSLTPSDVVLLREDGLGDEITALDQGACVYIAEGLGVGKWRIRAESNSSKISVLNVSVINSMNPS